MEERHIDDEGKLYETDDAPCGPAPAFEEANSPFLVSTFNFVFAKEVGEGLAVQLGLFKPDEAIARVIRESFNVIAKPLEFNAEFDEEIVIGWDGGFVSHSLSVRVYLMRVIVTDDCAFIVVFVELDDTYLMVMKSDATRVIDAVSPAGNAFVVLAALIRGPS